MGVHLPSRTRLILQPLDNTVHYYTVGESVRWPFISVLIRTITLISESCRASKYKFLHWVGGEFIHVVRELLKILLNIYLPIVMLPAYLSITGGFWWEEEIFQLDLHMVVRRRFYFDSLRSRFLYLCNLVKVELLQHRLQCDTDF